jgi:hypothetical protein
VLSCLPTPSMQKESRRKSQTVPNAARRRAAHMGPNHSKSADVKPEALTARRLPETKQAGTLAGERFRVKFVVLIYDERREMIPLENDRETFRISSF